MKKLPKILVGSLTSQAKDYCFLDWIVNVDNFTYPNLDLFISDNSPNLEYAQKLKAYTPNVGHIRPKNKPITQVLCESHNQIRDFFLKGNYEYLLHLESDILPPPTVIESLLYFRTPVISAKYFINQGSQSRLCITAFNDTGYSVQLGTDGRTDDLIFCSEGIVQRVAACGLGCTLISRNVMKAIEFRWMPGIALFPDAFFYNDLFELGTDEEGNTGVPAYLHTGVHCLHRNQNWEENPDFITLFSPKKQA